MGTEKENMSSKERAKNKRVKRTGKQRTQQGKKAWTQTQNKA